MASIHRIILVILLWSSYCQAQVQLSNFYPASANYYDTLHIIGRGFGSNANAISVNIGAGTAKIISVEDQHIKVLIPSTATFGKIVVTDLVNYNSAFFSKPFYPTYQVASFDYTHLNSQLSIINEEEGLYDLCTCDFDQDGDNDIATVNNDEAAKLSSVNVFSNTTASPDNVNFVKVPGSYFNINQPARNIQCSDINGDGKQDLIISQGGTVAENIYVFQNMSTSSPAVIKFASPIILSTAFEGLTKGTRRIKVHDLDGDLKPEIIVSNQTSPVLIIFKNASTNANIKFPSDQRHFITVPSNTLGLEINDLDDDNKPDIIASNNLGNDFYIIKNLSTQGEFSFAQPQTISLSGQLVNIASGDIDGDKKQDIILTDFEDGAILLLLNQSTSDNYSFASPIRMNAAIQPWGIDLADISGNQQLDIIVSTQAASDKILILKNNSLPGDPNFELIQAGYASMYRNINVADINNDSKPDIVSTERDAFGNYHIAYVQNQSCIEVKVFPENPPAICEASPLLLYTHAYESLNYQWFKDGAPLTGQNQSTLSVNEAGTYTLQMIDPYGSCTGFSEDIDIIEDSGMIPEAPEIIAPTDVCEGNDLSLSTTFKASLSYFWTGPNGFESTEINPIISNVGADHAGEYQLEVREGLCKSSIRTVFINVNLQDKIEVSKNGSLTLCPKDSLTLSINNLNLRNIQWYKNNQIIVGANSEKLVAKEAGDYKASAENVQGCPIFSDVFKVEKIALSADFSLSSISTCIGDTITFTSIPTQVSGITHQWQFGDGSQDFGDFSTHVYTQAGNFTITHTVILDDGNCSNTATQTITINPTPDFEIIASSEMMCKNDTITLSISGDISSLVWEDGSNENVRLISKGGTYAATVFNEFNCSTTHSVTIQESVNPEIYIDTEGKNYISIGDSIQLFAQGGIAYVWQASEGLSDTSIANPFVKPIQTTSYTVTGYSEAGCSTTATVTIHVDIDKIILDALDIYTPNDDGIEDHWIIKNIDQYPECYFLIFDIQGREVFRSETPYQNDWSGTNHQGNPLPAGVYYYVLRCGDDKNKGSGSVTLLR